MKKRISSTGRKKNANKTAEKDNKRAWRLKIQIQKRVILEKKKQERDPNAAGRNTH